MTLVSVVDGGALRSLADQVAEAEALTGDIDEDLRVELDEAVRRGIEFLDGWKPGWLNLIDLDTLDLSCCFACIFGQLEGDFWTAMPKINRGVDNGCGVIEVDWEWATSHGFSRPDFGSYGALATMWRKHITARRALGVIDSLVLTFDADDSTALVDA